MSEVILDRGDAANRDETGSRGDVSRTATSTEINNPPVTVALSRSIGPQREPIGRATQVSRTISNYVPSTFSGGNTLSGSSQNGATPTTNIPATGFNYGDNPLGILADLFRNVYGADEGIVSGLPSEIVAVPVSAETGTSNLLPVLMILAAAGFGIYWYYYR